MHERPTLHILDGAYFAHRSWHRRGRPPLENFVQLLFRLLQRETPSHFVVAWEPRGTTFRHRLYERYKAHRPEQPPELVEHIERCRAASEALGAAVVTVEGFEGDDVAASFAKQWAEHGNPAVVHTADKDLLQLVDDRIRVAIKKHHHTADDVRRRLGVPPNQVADLLALAGDSADGIPGVPGIGPQTAAQYLSIWNDIDGIFANRHHLTESKRAALWDARELLPVFRQLTRVRVDIALPLDFRDTLFVPRMDRFRAFCASHGIDRLIRLEAYDDVRYELDERVAIMLDSDISRDEAIQLAVHAVFSRYAPWISRVGEASSDAQQH